MPRMLLHPPRSVIAIFAALVPCAFLMDFDRWGGSFCVYMLIVNAVLLVIERFLAKNKDIESSVSLLVGLLILILNAMVIKMSGPGILVILALLGCLWAIRHFARVEGRMERSPRPTAARTNPRGYGW